MVGERAERNQPVEYVSPLTNRNKDIADLVVNQGWTQSAAAVKYGISQKTVSVIIRQYMRSQVLVRRTEGPEQSRIRFDTIEHLTEDLGYVNKPFHLDWYKLAGNLQFLLKAPRNHAKSTCLSILLPLYEILRNPEIRILLVSNTDKQARAFVRAVKQLIEQNFKFLVPFGRTTWTDSQFIVRRTGFSKGQVIKEATMAAVGVEGPILSKRQDLIICDDVVDLENAATQDQRDKVYDWFRTTLLPALEPKTGRIIVIGTPFRGGDLYEKLQKDWPKNYRIYDAIVNEEAKISLWPERIPYECPENMVHQNGERHEGWCCLMDIKRQMGVVHFNGQFRCDVSGYVGEKLRREWLEEAYYTTLPREFTEIIIGVDPAIRQKESADYFAMATVGYSQPEGKVYVIDLFRDHIPYPKQIWQITEHALTYHPNRILLEVTGYQEALQQGLENSMLPIIPVKTVTDKLTRILKISPYFEQRRIRVRPDMTDFLEEYVQFDQGDHDDLLDALAIAVQDIIDRFQTQKDYHPQLAFQPVWRSRMPVELAYASVPGTTSDAGRLSMPVLKADKATGGIVCLVCGKHRPYECKGHEIPEQEQGRFQLASSGTGLKGL